MESSSTYQVILSRGRTLGLEEGRLAGERQALLRIGQKRFGEPGKAVLAQLEAITSTEQLGGLMDRLLEVASWKELLT